MLPLISATQAARIAGADPRTVRRWVTEDLVPGLGIVIGGRVYVRPQALESLLGIKITMELGDLSVSRTAT